MASEHEFSLLEDTSNPPSCTVDSNVGLSDSVLLQFIDSFNHDSQLLLNEYHGNDPTTLSQNLQPSHHQQSTSVIISQPENSLNIHVISQSKHHQPSEDVSNTVHNMSSEIRFHASEDAVSHILSGTEFFQIQNRQSFGQDLYIPQPSEVDCLHPPTTQCFDTVQGASQQFISERYDSSENRSNTIQETHRQIELGVNKSNLVQSSYSSMEKCSEMNMNRLPPFDSVTRKQPWKEAVVSQIPYSLSHQATQEGPNVGQIPYSTQDVLGNEICTFQAREVSDYLPNSGESSTAQDLPLQSFQQSVRKDEDTQSLYPQGLMQSGRDPNTTRIMDSNNHPEFRVNFTQDCEVSSTTKETQNQTIAIQGLPSLNRQQVESETLDKLKFLQQTLAVSPQKRHLPPSYSEQLKVKKALYTMRHKESQSSTSDYFCQLSGNHKLPPSYSEHMLKRGSKSIPHAENHPSTGDFSCTLLGNHKLPPSYSEHMLKRRSKFIPHAENQPSTSDTFQLGADNRQLPHSQSRQQPDRGTYAIRHAEIQRSTDTFWPGSDNRQLPQSQSGQQPDRGTYTSPLAESQPDIPDTYPLPDTFLQLNGYKERKQFMTSNQRFLKVNPEYVDLRMLQNPYSNRSEYINIFVCGHPHWTNFFLETLSGDIPVNKTSPYYFVIHRNMIRCGMLVNVFVWKINNLVDSTSFLVSYCLSSRSTIVYVENILDRPDLANALQKKNVTNEIKRSVVHEMSARLQWLSNFMPNELGRNVPIVFVWGKYSRGKYNRVSGYSFRKILDLNNTCFRLKSRHNLSAYMECSVDSADEVKEVVFTAIDVAFLGNVGATPIVL